MEKRLQAIGTRAVSELRSISFEEGLFYTAFALCVFVALIMRTTYPNVFGISKELFEPAAYVLVALLLLAKLVLDRSTSWRFIVAVALVPFSFVSFWIAGVWRFSVLFLFIAAGKGVSLRRLAGIALILHLAFCLVTIPLAALGKLYSFTVWREVDGVWRPRLSYGFSHPNFLGQVFLTLALCCAVLRFPRFGLLDLAIYLFFALAAALLVWARTATVCIVLVAVIAALSPWIVRSQIRQRWAAGVSLCCFMVLAVFSFAMMAAYNPEIGWMNWVDQMLSKRLSIAHRFFEVFPPTPFGRGIMAVKVDDFLQEMPDNVYAYVLVKQGIVTTLVLGVLVVAAYVCAIRASKWSACIFGLVVFAFGGVMEAYAVDFTLDFFLIACAFALYGDSSLQAGEADGG